MPAATFRLVAELTTVAVVGALTMSAGPTAQADETPGAAPPATSGPGRYIVALRADPIATYAGGTPGMTATRPAKGRKVEVAGAAATRYRAFLTRQQSAAAARVGATPVHSYTVALNGFTADLTGDQAAALAKAPGVRSVTRDVARRTTDDRNPVDFLRLSGSKGAWDAVGGKSKAGRGVVVGVLDTGIWPESASFAGSALSTRSSTTVGKPYRDGNAIVMRKADGDTFVGACQAGATPADDFGPADCNTKVISARAYTAGFLANVPPERVDDYLSPRDGDGHGSHTASTAAGDAGVTAEVEGRSFGKISGMAPSAKIAAYKVCYTSRTEAETGCYTSDSLEAIDQAVTDGVDVINFSIGSSDSLADPVDLAFMSAAAAGIFVAASAGNSGPGASTVEHAGPWLTTVAASTAGPYAATVALGNGKKYAGISTTVAAKTAAAPLVLAAAVKTTAATTADASLCRANTLDPARATGRIVVCDRGGNARTDKSAEVKRVGARGMVLVNLTDNSRDGDTHAVPTVHLNLPDSSAVRAYAGTSGATASFVPGNTSGTKITYPQVAGFSSRGPSAGAGGNLLKPDIAAPGVAILAAVAPPSNQGRSFDFYSGTSMSSPHIAGLAALYLGRYPGWSPMAVKSAMMTTARLTVDARGNAVRDAYAQGAGNVRPWRMLKPGVVFDSGLTDWLGFLAGQGIDFGVGIKATDPTELNVASIAVGRLVGKDTVTRKVTAVKAGTYKIRADVPGYSTTVSPKKLKFSRAGQTKKIEVTFTRTTAAFDQAAFGSVHLTRGDTDARLPVALTATRVAAPAEVSISGTSGSKSYDVASGLTNFTAAVRGLGAGTSVQGAVNAADDAVDQVPFTVPTGTKLARFDLRSGAAGADIDLKVYRQVGSAFALVAASETGSGDEQVTLTEPAPGSYRVDVLPYADAAGTTETAYTVNSVAVPATSAGNLTVTPSRAPTTPGQTLRLTLSWSGLTPGTPYLGYVEYPGGARTVVSLTP